MRVQFTNTLEDLKEATRTHERAAILGFRDPRSGMRRPARVVVFWVAVVAMVIAFFIIQQRREPAPQPTPQVPRAAWWFNFLVFFVTGMLLFLAFIWFVMIQPRISVVRRIWESNPAMHLHKTLDADASGLVLDDGQTRREMKWTSLRRYLESPNLFLLCPIDTSYDMVPKRAFGSAGQVDEFRRLLDEQISRAPAGFR